MKKIISLIFGLFITCQLTAQSLDWNGLFVDMGESPALKNDQSKSNCAQIRVFPSGDIFFMRCYGNMVTQTTEEDDYLLVTVEVPTSADKFTVETVTSLELDIPVEPASLKPGHIYNIKIIENSKYVSTLGFLVDDNSSGGIEILSIVVDSAFVEYDDAVEYAPQEAKDDSDYPVYITEAGNNVDTSSLHMWVDEKPSFTKIKIKTLQDFQNDSRALQDYISKHVEYPASKKAEGKQGETLVSCIIGRDGTVSDVNVSQTSGYSDFDEAAINVVKKLPKFKPALLQGVKVKYWLVIKVPFDLNR